MRNSVVRMLTSLRKSSGLSQEKLAELADIPFRSYQRLESGEVSPRIEIIFRLLNVLKADPTKVFIDLFLVSAPKAQSEPGKKTDEYHPFANSLSPEPLLIELNEIEGLKRALSGDYERGISEIGYWEWDFHSHKFFWSAQMYKIYGMEITENFDFEDYLSRIPPEDHQEIENGIQRLIEHNITYENTHRVNFEGNTWKVRGIGKKFLNTQGELIIFGIAERVT